MSRHRMPRGSASGGDDAADVPVDTPTEGVEPDTVEPTEAVEAVEPADEATEIAETPEDAAEPEAETTADDAKPGTDWARVLAYGVLPGLALLLVIAAGFLKWQDDSDRTTDINNGESAASEAMETAKQSTITMLSYKPDTVEKQLNDARDLLTGDFRDSYTTLINDVVIPGAQQKQITAVASVPAVASVSADRNEAVVLVFVNQTVVVGQDPPSDTASSVRVTMEKVDDRWLISEFEPV